MRPLLIVAALLLSPTIAPATAEPGVERVTLAPGESAAFTLAQGYSHQLLVPIDPDRPAPKAIIVRYRIEGGESVITVISKTGYPTRCSVLADPRGTGGFVSRGNIDSRRRHPRRAALAGLAGRGQYRQFRRRAARWRAALRIAANLRPAVLRVIVPVMLQYAQAPSQR